MNIGVDQPQGIARHERHRGVDHVLAATAKVDEGSGIPVENTDGFFQGLDQRNGNVAGATALAHDFRNIE